jgi:hypothetical protein
MNETIQQDIALSTEGMGIAIYSKGCMSGVETGADFFSSDFADPRAMAAHIRKGDITGFCTGSGGDFLLKIREGYPDAQCMEAYPIAVRLGLEVREHTVSFIDLFWLMDWDPEVPAEQQITLEDGFYHLTVLTRKPESGIWGEDQTIYLFFKKLDAMPELSWNSVPQLFRD